MSNVAAPLAKTFGQSTLGETLLTPTRIYIPALKALQKTVRVHAIAHITGGGLIDNLPRVLPPHTQALIESQSWEIPDIFQWLEEQGKIDRSEMWRAFNMGVGMVICVSRQDAMIAMDTLKAAGESAWILGHIVTGTERIPTVRFT